MQFISYNSPKMDKDKFSLVAAPSFNRRYRPDPSKSPEEELYSLSDNPSPSYELLQRLYAYHANGTVKVWVKDEAQLSTLRLPLQVLTYILFNPNIFIYSVTA